LRPALIVEFSKGPEMPSGKGDLTASNYASVSAEFNRIDTLLKPMVLSQVQSELS
jgi:hypothetical protein